MNSLIMCFTDSVNLSVQALAVVDYCLHVGSENMVIYFRDELNLMRGLCEFQYIDAERKDRGASVRQMASSIVEQLERDVRLLSEREMRAVRKNQKDMGRSYLHKGLPLRVPDSPSNQGVAQVAEAISDSTDSAKSSDADITNAFPVVHLLGKAGYTLPTVAREDWLQIVRLKKLP
jgi:hypothetical protein